METKEKRIEQDIEYFLITKGGYRQFVGNDFNAPEGTNVWLHNYQHDIDKCIYLDVMVEFLKKTQPKVWAKYEKYYGENAPERFYTRFEKVVSEQGLIFALRHGIDDMGMKFKLCFFKPESNLNPDAIENYESNILGCTRQFRYSPNNNNTIDMVLSLNGIPIVAIELKNQLTGQDYTNAIKQYKTDRSSKEFAFRLNHRFLVYFAVDHYDCYMTTALKDSATYFIPFNKGSNGAGNPGKAGNPVNPDGYATSYLWEEVLTKDSLLDIIHRFISFVEEKEEITKNGVTKKITNQKIIFPRYHQYDVVKKSIADIKSNGPGTNYLIEHSAGSGKSNSIAWLAYRLATAHNEKDEQIFNSVIVVTNRIVLDNQLQSTIMSFDHQAGLVETIDEKKNSKSLAEAINDGKRIIICTIQKFIFAYKDIEKITGRNFAIIVDEAHQGQSGESAKTLKKSLIDVGVAVKDFAEWEDLDENEVDITDAYINAILGQGKHNNQSFFAFTATPKGETLELFGTYDPLTNSRKPFHVYSMTQAIEEGFILDVLKNYTTIKEAFKLIKTSADNPELIEGPAAKALFKYYKAHGYTINQKTEMIMANFLENCRYQIDGKGKAMVVADSRANAVRYYLAIKKYIAENKEECKGTNVCVAFSGEVKLDEYPDEVFTESTMNKDEDGHYITTDKKFRKAFHTDLFNIMVVANKYQTGFDEPLLHSMYVDKKLRDISAVQTLSRLNRTCRGKNSTFVMDFENTADDIKKSFLPYYDITVLEGDTDLNKVYDLRTKVRSYNVYNQQDIEKFNTIMNAKQNEASLGKLAGMLKPVIARYDEMNDDDRYAFRDMVRKFNGGYSYVTQLVALHDKELFEEYQFTSSLIRFLKRTTVILEEFLDKVQLEYASLEETFKGQIVLDEKPPVFVPGDSTEAKKPNEKKDTLQNIIDKINEKFDGKFTGGDKVIVEGIYQMFMQDDDVKRFKELAKNNSTEMFVNSLFPDKFQEIVTRCFTENAESFDKLFTDPEFYKKVMETMANELYRSLRK